MTWLALLGAGLALALLTACSSKEERPADQSAPAASPTPPKKVLTMNNGAFEDEKDRLAEQDLVRRMFEERYPGWTIENQPWQYDPAVFIPKVQSGTCSDIVGLFATEGAMVIQQKLATDLTDLVATWEAGRFMIPEIIAPYMRDGRLYGLPVGDLTGAYVMTLFYNKKLFREAGIVDENGEPRPPQTWDEFVETARRLTDRKAGRAGFGILGDANAAGWHFLNWVWQAGGDFQQRQPDGTWKSVFDSPEAVSALQFIKDLRWKHDVLQYNLLCNNDDLMEMFVAERIAMGFFAPENLVYFKDKYQMPIEHIGIALLPAGPAGRANQMGGNFNIIVASAPEDHKLMAFKYLTEFIYDPEVIEARCRLLQSQNRVVGVPSLPAFQPEQQEKLNAIIAKYRNFPDYSALMNEAAKYVRVEPPHYCQALYSEFLSPAVQQVLTNKNADPAAILKEKNAQFQKQYLDKVNRQILAETP
ncbi:MAG: extracellular solute-binding protein [Candidatus Sumerlaeia bacterium]